MPTETFMKLSKEKQDKIILAAKKEFSRVAFEETSIKNIVEDAGIARGSFYQYFESKEDLLKHLMFDQNEKVDNLIQEKLTETNGDIFETFLVIYDYMVNELFTKADCEFHKRIFENMRTSEDSLFTLKPSMKEWKEAFKKKDIYSLINTSFLRTQEKEDVIIIIKMLCMITRKALASNFKYESKEEARKEYVKQLDYLKYGTCNK